MKEDFQIVKMRLPGICKIASDFYLTPKRKGSVFFVKSPYAHDSDWSLALYTNNNMFVDFANGGFKGDSIAFLAYIRDCNQWQALKILKDFYGLSDAKEQDKQEIRRKIQRQQEQERKKRERQKAFKNALFGEISRLKRWADFYTIAVEKCLYEPFSGMWCYIMDELQRTERKLDILCSSNQSEYRFMKTSSDCIPSDRFQWILDCLGVLRECGAFQATEEEIREITAQRDFELTRKPGAERRCKVEW